MAHKDAGSDAGDFAIVGELDVCSDQCWRDIKKVLHPLGTCFENAFHASMDSSNLLSISLYSDILPYHCLPACGVYHVDDYAIADNLCILIFPSEPVLENAAKILPVELSLLLSEHVAQSSDLVVVVLVHGVPQFDSRGIRQVNVMYHMWGFNLGVPVDDDHLTLLVGGFGSFGIAETAQDIVEELNGLPVNRLGPRIQYMHDGFSLSPHNCQVLLQEDHSIHSFFSYAIHPSGKSVLSYHIIPSSQDAGKLLGDTISNATTVGDLLMEFKKGVSIVSDLSVPFKAIHALLSSL